MKQSSWGQLIFSPNDLTTFVKSPFAAWMDRYYFERPDMLSPDKRSEDQALFQELGYKHERDVLIAFKEVNEQILEVPTGDWRLAHSTTRDAIKSGARVIYQAALEGGRFAGYADFLIGDGGSKYQVWDAKLAGSVDPIYAVQLCCYTEMLATLTGCPLSEKFGLILGTKNRTEYRTEDFIHYYRGVKSRFLTMQDSFSPDISQRPEPVPYADHGRWASYAVRYFETTDHLVQVAGITSAQIKRLKRSGIMTMNGLASSSGVTVAKLAAQSLEALSAQARLQCGTLADRKMNPGAIPRYDVLPGVGANGEPVGLSTLPPEHPADMFIDLEGYPLYAGGLEYLFGACEIDQNTGEMLFHDLWAHNREQEKCAFDLFVERVYSKWSANPGMHIYHYGAYEVSALQRLSTRHDTRQDEIDSLLRNHVFVDLYNIVRHGLRVGERDYSIKRVERLYRHERNTSVSDGFDSVVQYAHWMATQDGQDSKTSKILLAIRDYNEDDCKSTRELTTFLRTIAMEQPCVPVATEILQIQEEKPKKDELIARLEIATNLRERNDRLSLVLADLIDFHRREHKSVWWRLFDRATSTADTLREDPGCIQGIVAVGTPTREKNSLVQTYRFDPSQDCKLKAQDQVMFVHHLDVKLNLFAIERATGELQIKTTMVDRLGGTFPSIGSLVVNEYVSPDPIPKAIEGVACMHLKDALQGAVAALLDRVAPAQAILLADESPLEATKRITEQMSGGCLVIQGPPGTGKTYVASRTIMSLLASGKKVGVTSNSHAAIVNLLSACGLAGNEVGVDLQGIKVGGERDEVKLAPFPRLEYISSGATARNAYYGGVVGATAWVFTRTEWQDSLDYLFIDEAGQVSLANAVGMARCAKNLVLMGDQMQLEQPIQGSHPGDAGMSVLQYALKDLDASRPDSPVFHAVVPADYGLFLGMTRRMHPQVCDFISDSIYEGRLKSHGDCAMQRIVVPADGGSLITKECGIVFIDVEHDGNVQQSDEEIQKILDVYYELLGRSYTGTDKSTRTLELNDFLFVAPYNSQVQALRMKLPIGARVGSVDKFQGQEAPVCILSLCSSFGDYGSRGLGFILDRNRINVAISRAQCLAVVVADGRIGHSSASTIEEMKLLNLFCKLSNPVISK